MKYCSCRDVTSVYSLNSRKLPGCFSYGLGKANEVVVPQLYHCDINIQYFVPPYHTVSPPTSHHHKSPLSKPTPRGKSVQVDISAHYEVAPGQTPFVHPQIRPTGKRKCMHTIIASFQDHSHLYGLSLAVQGKKNIPYCSAMSMLHQVTIEKK